MIAQGSVYDTLLRLFQDALLTISRLTYQVRTVTEVSCPLFRGELPIASTDPVFTMKKSTTLTIREILLCNTTGAPINFFLAITDPGAAASVDRRYWDTYPIAAKETIRLDLRTLLISEERLYAWASGAGLNCRISALEVTPL